jgi:hypothetical protein
MVTSGDESALPERETDRAERRLSGAYFFFFLAAFFFAIDSPPPTPLIWRHARRRQQNLSSLKFNIRGSRRY